MRLRLTFLCGQGLLLTILGCEQRIPKDELGTVVFSVPAIGDDKPPPLPDLEGAQDSHGPPPGRPH
jgi:hypothetical protein